VANFALLGVLNVTLKMQNNSVAFTFIRYHCKHGKGKFILKQAMKPKKGNRVIALHFI